MKKKEERLKEDDQRKQAQIVEEKRTKLARQDAIKKQIYEQQRLEEAELIEHDTAQKLIAEATEKLTVSLNKNDIMGAKVAQVMLAAGNDKLQKTSKLLNDIRHSNDSNAFRDLKMLYNQKLDRCMSNINVEGEPSKKKPKK